jgi:hypothetical protein
MPTINLEEGHQCTNGKNSNSTRNIKSTQTYKETRVKVIRASTTKQQYAKTKEHNSQRDDMIMTGR